MSPELGSKPELEVRQQLPYLPRRLSGFGIGCLSAGFNVEGVGYGNPGSTGTVLVYAERLQVDTSCISPAAPPRSWYRLPRQLHGPTYRHPHSASVQPVDLNATGLWIDMYGLNMGTFKWYGAIPLLMSA